MKWRYDGRCGRKYRLPDGTAGQCDPDGDKPCCSDSWDGKCGNTTEHCTCKNCTDYRRIRREWRESGGTQKWRYDGRCGNYYPLPDGTPGQCNPDGDRPCCSRYGECGNTTEHCTCNSCTDYRRIHREWNESNGTQKWRYDGRCGNYYPLPDGTPGQCNPDGDRPCCSRYGECGNTTEHCTCNSCTDYKFLKDWNESNGTKKWRYDGKCGEYYPLPDATPGQCDPDGDKPCCGDSRYGECGNTAEHCSCYGCTDFKLLKDWNESNGTKKWRYDGRCGSYYPLPDGTAGQCDPDGDKPCCSDSRDGECGNTAGYCDCIYCTNYTRIHKDWKESGGTQKWRYDGRCGINYRLPDGTIGQCDPDGDKPCCSDSWDGECGNTAGYCDCIYCTNYTRIHKDWKESGGTQKWRYDGRCGRGYPLPDGTAGQCDPDGDRPCCSGRRNGECGNTTEHCTCYSCTDYKFLKDWNESNGTMKWRYDGRCGYNFPLPDGTIGQCDPDGDKPCCGDSRDGECRNTTEDCTCSYCIDYRRIRREWRESGGTQKWRYDGRCGSKNPLPDGTPGECDPDGDTPCCSDWRYGWCTYLKSYCLCTDCIDYSVLRQIRNSRQNCTVAKIYSGFLKHVCFYEDQKKFSYKCLHSESRYKITTSTLSYQPDSVSKVCENDLHAYQACFYSRQEAQITNSDVLCGGYFCDKKEEDGKHKYVECVGDKCKPENRNCVPSRDNTTICNDQCDEVGCRDESYCNGYQYGVECQNKYVSSPSVCGQLRINCVDGSDKYNCNVTKGTVHKCVHYLQKHLGKRTQTVPIHNFTRCSVIDANAYPYPYCLDYLDQTNCSDVERVGGYCKINGYMSTVSKYMVCNEYKIDPNTKLPINLCEDDFQNKCLNPSTSDCRVHKHWMCDEVDDCPDGTDEVHDMCKTMTIQLPFVCKRRFDRVQRTRTSIPVSWILDNEIDCMNGEDENVTKWMLCSGDIKKVVLPGEKCQNLYKCSHRDATASSIFFDQLCDGVESCGNGTENNVCRIARDFPDIDKIVHYTKDSIRDVCHYLEHTETCRIREFDGQWQPSEIFGVDRKILLNVPTSQISCADFLGENYLFLSCMGLCSEEDAACPLENKSKLQYNSCPGQFLDRAITLADNSFLTFVTKSDRGYYHQEFYQCKNRRCIDYKQVCDLVDDCGDMSDEINCTVNHMICEDTKNLTKHHYISLTRQKCDGIYDCFDLSDECNESCSKQILGNFLLKCTCWLMGILALVFNFYVIIHGLSTIKNSETENMMISKSLMSLIGSGDFLIGLYLIILSVYDSLVFGKDYCRKQAEWLTGSACLTLGVISTVGSQISLFSMTVMSFIKMFGLLYRSMRIPGPANKKAAKRVILMCSIITLTALAVAVIPLVPFLEDYFVQGM